MKKWVMILCLALFGPSIVCAAEGTPGDLYAESAVLADGDNGRVLYEKNGEEFRAIASTTKIMTAVLAFEQGMPDQICTVSAYAASMPAVKLGLRPGETYYLRDLLYALMLESSNDAAVVIAESIGTNVEGFAEKMNRKAKELGAEHTIFVTPNGLDAPGQGATAQDLAKIAAYAIKNEKFCELIQTRTYSFSSLDGKRRFTVTNKNAFLDQMEGAMGIKTGYTGQAGYCFVGALKDADRVFISVVLGSGWPPYKNQKWEDTGELMKYGLEHYQKKELLEETPVKKMIAVTGGVRDYVLAIGSENPVGLMKSDEKAVVSYDGAESLAAPVESGDICGVWKIRIHGDAVHEQDMRITRFVGGSGKSLCFLEIFWRVLSFQGCF